MKTTAKEFLQNKYPQMRGHLWNSNPNINDEWVAEIMEEYASEQTAKYKEFIEAYQNLLNCFGMSKPKNKTNIDSLDKAWERITALEKEISINLK